MAEEKGTESVESGSEVMKEDEMAEEKGAPKRLSRREFVKGAAAGAAGAAAVGALASCAPAATPMPAETPAPCPTCPPAEECPPCPTPGLPETWDKEADVVVVGYGGAGAAAAITAHEAGAKVLILEKLPGSGGSTAMSGGYLTGVNSSAQKERGITDSVDDGVAYHLACGQGMVEENIVKAWAEKSGETVDFLVGLGAEIDDIIPDFQPDFPGAGTRSHHVAGMGVGMFEPLREAVESREIEALTETRGKALIADAGGTVVGIKAESDGSELYIKAKRAIVLATGGFVYDEQMVLHFLKNDSMAGVGCPACEGDGIKMGMALGANLKVMNEVAGTIAIKVPGQAIAVPSMLALAGFPFVMVNKAGKRFVDEELPYDRGIIPFDVYDPVKMEYANIPAYAIFDDDTYHLGAIGYSATAGAMWSTDNLKELEAGAILQADSIRELAAAIDVDPDGLEETVNTWNADAAAGQDTEFGRTMGLAPIAKAPFYAANHWPGVWDTAGGLEVNEGAQVVNVFGEVIPRLYAAGTTAATIIGHIYPISGTAIGGAITFGRIAGENAAAEEPWE